MNLFSSPTWLNAAISYAGNKKIESMKLDEAARLQGQRLIHEAQESAYDRTNARIIASINASSHVESADIGAKGKITSAAIKAISPYVRDGIKYGIGPAGFIAGASINSNKSESANKDKDEKNKKNGTKPPTAPPPPLQVELVDPQKRINEEARKKAEALFNPSVLEWVKLVIPAFVATGSALLSPMYVL